MSIERAEECTIVQTFIVRLPCGKKFLRHLRPGRLLKDARGTLYKITRKYKIKRQSATATITVTSQLYQP